MAAGGKRRAPRLKRELSGTLLRSPQYRLQFRVVDGFVAPGLHHSHDGEVRSPLSNPGKLLEGRISECPFFVRVCFELFRYDGRALQSHETLFIHDQPPTSFRVSG